MPLDIALNLTFDLHTGVLSEVSIAVRAGALTAACENRVLTR